MAVVTSFEPLQGDRFARHRTEVVAHYKVLGGESNGPLFQINTYGSEDRSNPDSVSQTLQLNRASAETLWKLLGQTYGFR